MSESAKVGLVTLNTYGRGMFVTIQEPDEDDAQGEEIRLSRADAINVAKAILKLVGEDE